MDQIQCTDRFGVQHTFDVRMTKEQISDTWNFEVYCIPRRPDNDFFPLSLELQDDGTLRIIIIGGNLGDRTWPEYSGMGIPGPLLAYATAQLNYTVVSSPTSGGGGVYRTKKATAMWERIEADGHASYDPINDIFTFIP